MKNIAHFENRYGVTEEGVIMNYANNSPLNPTINSNGYLKVGLAKGDGTHEQMLVHRIVAKHFIPNPYDHPEVNHKDGNKLNCAKDNLEWTTSQGNVHHAFETGLRPGYMSANDKEAYLVRVLAGEKVKDIASAIGRTPETLHKMLRTTAERLGKKNEWDIQMKENRRATALLNLNP